MGYSKHFLKSHWKLVYKSFLSQWRKLFNENLSHNWFVTTLIQIIYKKRNECRSFAWFFLMQLKINSFKMLIKERKKTLNGVIEDYNYERYFLSLNAEYIFTFTIYTSIRICLLNMNTMISCVWHVNYRHCSSGFRVLLLVQEMVCCYRIVWRD